MNESRSVKPMQLTLVEMESVESPQTGQTWYSYYNLPDIDSLKERFLELTPQETEKYRLEEAVEEAKCLHDLTSSWFRERRF